MAGLVEKDFRLIWCNKQALIFLLIIGVVIGLQNGGCRLQSVFF